MGFSGIRPAAAESGILLYKPNISSKDKQKLTFYFKRSKIMIKAYELLKQHEIVAMMRHFVRF